jgi:AcrR family transcriptional regulator
MTKVDRRIAKTQEALKKAIIELMSEKNFDSITIQDIADQANLSRGTIYLHYQDKYDLLDRLIDSHMDELKDMDEWACKMEWESGLTFFFEYFEKNFLFFSTMLTTKSAPTFRSRLLKYVMEGLVDDIDRESGKNDNIEEDVMLQYTGTAYVGVIEWWIKNSMPYPPNVMAGQVAVLLRRSLNSFLY